MPRLQVTSTSIVVLGDVFAPSLLTPDLLRQFFGDEGPRGLTTDMVAHLEYPLSKYRVTLEESKFQVLKQEPDPAHLEKLTKIVSHFLKKNPLVRVTAVGLNFNGFVSYAGGARTRRAQEQNGETEFLRTFAVLDALKELVGSDIRSGTLHVVYQAEGHRCGLTLRSDAVLKDNKGVALDLNVHRDVSKRKEVYSHIDHLGDWLDYFAGLAERLSRYV